MTTEKKDDRAPASPPPAWKVRCPYCGGTGWRDTGDGGGWKCSWCSGTGWVWTEGGAW